MKDEQDEQFISTEQAAEAFDGIGDQLGAEAPNFMQIDCYTTFRAEYAVLDDDLVFHFFANDEINQLPNPWHYWKTTFPKQLEQVAGRYFAAAYPRVRAAYADELASWWLRADGFDHVLDMNEFAHRFLEQLDRALESDMGPS